MWTEKDGIEYSVCSNKFEEALSCKSLMQTVQLDKWDTLYLDELELHWKDPLPFDQVEDLTFMG